MSFALPLAAGAVGQSLATDLAWTVASNYSISTATFDAIIGAGFIAGAALAGAFLAPGLPGTEGPRVMDGMGQVSTYGKFLPVLYGRNRIAGNVIWSKGIREVATTTESGGKGGGGGSSSTSYTYYCSWAVGLCEGKVRDIHKIWFDFDLVYEQNGSVNGAINDKTTFYYGTDDQTADPLMQAAQGATDTPAYRGVSYIVFNDILLSDWNNRIPNITVELSRFPDVGETSNIYPVEMDIDGYTGATNYTSGSIVVKNFYQVYDNYSPEYSSLDISLLTGLLRTLLLTYNNYQPENVSLGVALNTGLLRTLLLTYNNYQPENVSLGLSNIGGSLT